MKKLFSLLMVAGMLSLVACGGGEENTEAMVDEAANELLEELDNALEEEVVEEAAAEEAAAEEAPAELAEHVCNDNCTPEACHTVCGEKGHECSDACHASEEGEGHDHEEGEGHDHGTEEEA